MSIEECTLDFSAIMDTDALLERAARKPETAEAQRRRETARIMVQVWDNYPAE